MENKIVNFPTELVGRKTRLQKLRDSLRTFNNLTFADYKGNLIIGLAEEDCLTIEQLLLIKRGWEKENEYWISVMRLEDLLGFSEKNEKYVILMGESND